MGGARLEALDELDLLGEHRLLALELRLLLLLVQCPLLLVELVIARIGVERSAVDLHHLGDDAVHELAIVRGHQQQALVAFQELLEPDQAFQVEVVARLVEQHRVGLHQENAAKRHAHFPSAGQSAHVAVHHLLAEAQAREHLARAAFERIAAELLEARLHLAVTDDDLVHLAGTLGVRHRGLKVLQLGCDRGDRPGAVHHLGHRAPPRHLADVLTEVADGRAAIDGHLSFVGLLLPGDHPEQRGLAGAVRADEPDLLALVERHRSLDEENLVAVLLADAVETNHDLCGETGTNCGRPYATPRADRKSNLTGAGSKQDKGPVARASGVASHTTVSLSRRPFQIRRLQHDCRKAKRERQPDNDGKDSGPHRHHPLISYPLARLSGATCVRSILSPSSAHSFEQ